jgi:REP element-mobilizing transposase RayT
MEKKKQKPPPLWLNPSKKPDRQPGDPDPYNRARHARYYEGDCVYHVVSRTLQGLFLLLPDADGELRRIIAGVIGHARKTYTGVRVHAAVFLSNHFHLAISGDHQQLAAYVGFIKREVARRWGPHIGWEGVFKSGYATSAVITPEGQRDCLRYILSQSVKEGLCERPEQWPGLHCAESLVTGKPIAGHWFNATDYGRAKRRQARKRNPAPVDRARYYEQADAHFAPLPALSHLSPEAYRAEMAALVEEVVAEARELRAGRPPLGVEAVLATDRMTRSEIPAPPWFEDRRRMVVWDDLKAPEVKAYLERYWTFQVAFRAAADLWRNGEQDVEFPPGAFWPGRARPIAHIQSIAA